MQDIFPNGESTQMGEYGKHTQTQECLILNRHTKMQIFSSVIFQNEEKIWLLWQHLTGDCWETSNQPWSCGTTSRLVHRVRKTVYTSSRRDAVLLSEGWTCGQEKKDNHYYFRYLYSQPHKNTVHTRQRQSHLKTQVILGGLQSLSQPRADYGYYDDVRVNH